jgi:hypothetical protein
MPAATGTGADPLCNPLLAGYWPSERRAILVHRFFLSMEQKREVPLEESIQSWEQGPAKQWRSDKMRRDGREQLREIERHKYHLSQSAGYDVGWERAAQDWVEKHAAAWRSWWEGTPEAGA